MDFMKNMIRRSGPQNPLFCGAAFFAAIVFSLIGCGEGFGANRYFEFDGASGTITGYDNDGPRDVTLPSSIDGIKVTAVGNNAFRGKRLTGLSILAGVIVIGEGAFADNRLASLVIFDCVADIGTSAFENNRLETLAIPDTVIRIGQNAFKNNRLTNVVIGSRVVYIEREAFSGNQLNSIVIPNSVANIGESAFSGNPLTSITIGANKDYASTIFPNFGAAYNNYYNKQAGTYAQVSGGRWQKQ
jgi:hypothetical protein